MAKLIQLTRACLSAHARERPRTPCHPWPHALSRAQNETQGPCSLTQFRGWVRTLRAEPRFKAQLDEFSNVSVWKARPPAPVALPRQSVKRFQAVGAWLPSATLTPHLSWGAVCVQTEL